MLLLFRFVVLNVKKPSTQFSKKNLSLEKHPDRHSHSTIIPRTTVEEYKVVDNCIADRVEDKEEVDNWARIDA